MEYKVRTVTQDGEAAARVTMVMAYHHWFNMQSSWRWQLVRNLWSKEWVATYGAEHAMVEYTGWMPLDRWLELKKSRNWRLLEAEFKKMK